MQTHPDSKYGYATRETHVKPINSRLIKDARLIKNGATLGLSFMSVTTLFINPAMISLGLVVLPAIGLHSMVVGGGSLSIAAISYMAGAGVSLVPALALLFLINKTIKNPTLSTFLQYLVYGGYLASSFLVGAALGNVSSTSLFLQALGGGLTITTMLFGAVLALVITALTFASIAGAIKSCCAKETPPSSGRASRHGFYAGGENPIDDEVYTTTPGVFHQR
jgi:hypothetical protein